MNGIGRILRFAIASGFGLTLDVVIFLTLSRLGQGPFTANAVSATCAVTFVYLVSVRRIFSYDGGFLFGLFLAYLAYQAAAVAAASLAVDALVELGLVPVLAKFAILPLTFGANYLFMFRLTAGARARRLGDTTR